eukprot:TRINITY_DN15909_c0_g1_i1.p1 TRINITY_DN15909_c0_g1~~TRINITY_DN15909_c0_g1_i1.p1  ORF type:complete len:103 (+),score=6.68 TRINITY_DN15909_c0_g1_i1:220-528(+)
MVFNFPGTAATIDIDGLFEELADAISINVWRLQVVASKDGDATCSNGSRVVSITLWLPSDILSTSLLGFPISWRMAQPISTHLSFLLSHPKCNRANSSLDLL